MNNNSVKVAEDEGYDLFKTVVDGGYCIGCGACAAVKGSPIKIKLDQYSKFQATIDNPEKLWDYDGIIQSVCPFSNKSRNEDEIGAELYRENAIYHNKIGYYISNYAGHVAEDGFRDRGSSGGMASWIAYTLFKEGFVDGVIHIHQRVPTDNDNRLFHYQISRSETEILNGAKSRYYPVELSEVIQVIRDEPSKFVLVGVPCFIKAVRLLVQNDEVLRKRIRFCIGLVCGHLKSARFAEMLGWESGIPPANLHSIDFRTKLDGFGANKYGVTVKSIAGKNEVTKISPPVDKMYGTDWGWGFFKYKACDYCDDVVAETADVTIGDAWLPKYLNDSKGTNIVVVRHPLIKEIIEKARAEKRVILETIDANEVAKSQRSGFNHRREGLAYRLFLTDAQDEWRPIKRVEAKEDHLIDKEKQRHILRIKMAEVSHIAFNKAIKVNSFKSFKNQLNPIVRKYKNVYFWKRITSSSKRIINKLKSFIK